MGNKLAVEERATNTQLSKTIIQAKHVLVFGTGKIWQMDSIMSKNMWVRIGNKSKRYVGWELCDDGSRGSSSEGERNA